MGMKTEVGEESGFGDVQIACGEPQAARGFWPGAGERYGLWSSSNS